MDCRKKWETKYRCNDGHYVRSRAEMIIDNWLYSERIVHCYEKKIIINNNPDNYILCDFYLPVQNVYIEFWGKSDDYYLNRERNKIENYKRENLTLISLGDDDLYLLDDTLPQKLARATIPF